jgi:hypothetical protein
VLPLSGRRITKPSMAQRQASIRMRASRRVRNHSGFRHSSRRRPLKLSFVPFCRNRPVLAVLTRPC